MPLNKETKPLNVKQFYLTHQVLPLQVRVDLRSMAMKGTSTFPKAPRQEPNHQMVYCYIQDTCLGWGVLTSLPRDAVGIFYSLSQLGCGKLESEPYAKVEGGNNAEVENYPGVSHPLRLWARSVPWILCGLFFFFVPVTQLSPGYNTVKL